jgi:hypothetical protein
MRQAVHASLFVDGPIVLATTHTVPSVGAIMMRAPAAWRWLPELGLGRRVPATSST